MLKIQGQVFWTDKGRSSDAKQNSFINSIFTTACSHCALRGPRSLAGSRRGKGRAEEAEKKIAETDCDLGGRNFGTGHAAVEDHHKDDDQTKLGYAIHPL